MFSIEEIKNEKIIRFGLGAIKGVGIKSISNIVKDREKNGNFKNIIDFLKRSNNEVINKRQLEKLIQAGAFDSIETNRAKLFYNVPKFVELFANDKDINQNLLFEEKDISFDDKYLFTNNYNNWNNLEKLQHELEVIGFHFLDHPLHHFPEMFFNKSNIKNFDNINSNLDLLNIKLAGVILDIKERSNKDGKKYAFLTVSQPESQFELTIFSENLYKYRYLLKEGNLLIFNIDILRKNEDIRLIIRDIKSLTKEFETYKLKFSIFSSIENIIKFKEQIFKKYSY